MSLNKVTAIIFAVVFFSACKPPNQTNVGSDSEVAGRLSTEEFPISKPGTPSVLNFNTSNPVEVNASKMGNFFLTQYRNLIKSSSLDAFFKYQIKNLATNYFLSKQKDMNDVNARAARTLRQGTTNPFDHEPFKSFGRMSVTTEKLYEYPYQTGYEKYYDNGALTGAFLRSLYVFQGILKGSELVGSDYINAWTKFGVAKTTLQGKKAFTTLKKAFANDEAAVMFLALVSYSMDIAKPGWSLPQSVAIRGSYTSPMQSIQNTTVNKKFDFTADQF